MNRRHLVPFLFLLVTTLTLMSVSPAFCQTEEPGEPQPPKTVSFSTDITLTSKFMWRGQRLTDGWCFQPSATVGAKGFSLNVWGNMELQAVNEGDTLLVKENPLAVGSPSGLRGRMSEVDITASYRGEVSEVAFEAGLIAYLLPYTGQSDPSTTELFGSLSLPSVLLSPTLTLYADVDESRNYEGTGMYLELTADHSFELSGSRVESIDLGARIGLTNSGYASYWYEEGVGAGFHDVGLGVSVPVGLGRGWTSTFSVGYSRLIGKYRDYQYVNLPALYLGTAGQPSTYADSVWGGVTFSLEK